MAGSIGPTGHLPASDDPTLGAIRFRELVAIFAEQAKGLVDGGADLLIIETAQDILEVKAAVFGAREAFAQTGPRLPMQTSVSLLPTAACCWARTSPPPWPRWRPCRSTSSASTAPPAPSTCASRCASWASTAPCRSCIPNAGLPHQGPDGETIFPEEPGPLADALGEFVDRSASASWAAAAACTPEHIRAIVERVGRAHPGRAPRAARRPRLLDDDRHAAGAGPGAHARSASA